MSEKMEMDRRLSEPSDLFSQLVSIINNNELIFQSLKFFVQDVTSVQNCMNVISILQTLKSKYEENDDLYQILEFIFKEIHLKTDCACSSKCINKIHEFSPVTVITSMEVPPSPSPLEPPHAPGPIFTPPVEYRTIDPPSSCTSLTDAFVFFELAKEIPVQQLDDFAVLGLRIPMVGYYNVIHQKVSATEKIKAVLNKWKSEAGFIDDPTKMPCYTKAGLIRALTDSRLNYVAQYVSANC